MTDKLDLDELEQLEQDVWRGPWTVSEPLDPFEVRTILADGYEVALGVPPILAKFIAALRNAAPRLFERVRELQEIEKMRCEMCSAVAPENEKDWPKTECVVCVLRARIAVLESERKSQWDQLQDRIADLERQAGEDEAWTVSEIERREQHPMFPAYCMDAEVSILERMKARLASRREGGGK